MSDMTIEEFCNRHGACRDGREWALANCKSMLEVWNTAQPDWLIWVATRRDVFALIELVKIVREAARRIAHLLTDQFSRDALLVLDKWISGEVESLETRAAMSKAKSAFHRLIDAAQNVAVNNSIPRYSDPAWNSAWAAYYAAETICFATAVVAGKGRVAWNAEDAIDSATKAFGYAMASVQPGLYSEAVRAFKVGYTDWLIANVTPNFKG